MIDAFQTILVILVKIKIANVRNSFIFVFKVAGQNPEVSTGIKIETCRNLSKPVETCHRNPSKPVKIERFGVLPRNLKFVSSSFGETWILKISQTESSFRQRLSNSSQIYSADNYI